MGGSEYSAIEEEFWGSWSEVNSSDCGAMGNKKPGFRFVSHNSTPKTYKATPVPITKRTFDDEELPSLINNNEQ
ncbi:hypothetical protein CROQUDRAFT_88537 [Cronartium quercuum f. sp. fusiforme G11]|uniref:Uncharacterized protein n=1 Tax=Cronartium quercuum f. sp. fusiforme G11 TaxID=708437 RepID=A0A9P6NTB5_9BASI|nr:hypothetical protein CROQUDRAFT_88537 [Cronartium quercuum f. sp. fusiforme G11]